ncbi:NADH-quinone oxidoreductase subunit NuoG [Burkholderia cenocepacia]|uniref:NADH-quinone oxidoreductase n=1 Tax=Burkholderia cenocepacia (strain ATCC BAA-245 / DSM 16553 / LMG 16656 / NCTC 13227 / J2315 / CF5610) TaxID=216591 RepID=B4E5L6_BURCJ|nr:NADH-quinone oxidoreductase subunit NuoG [Burkholderia cenocepacia]KIS47245.1 NADH dehydrogenase (quinone), G subunit [Burkholderia cepacia]EPZ86151.1 NADH dehydrogenase (quinone), G subunit [Burkholderia cenocepacia K56-2Valvano]ERI28196.1 NADH dehydrogenase (quinone), G subunit [Burkholderia cenocepacia BC7]KKI78492.1 NADH dehydrogenase [Burkholderia cenocepacia]ONR49692.1 NADH-quinone oxidoreductase subunit G [Burkholderia cenocepacia]
MVELEIDGKKVEVPEGSMVIQAAHKADTYIPHFCYHKKLSVAANCRMCLVEVEKMPKAVPACATPVSAGMIVRTQSDKAVKAQQSVMEFLLINHPLDCPICDQGGECQLQDLAVGYGKSSSRYSEEKRVVFHKNVGPLISMEEMSRCIHCTRCVRFGQEIAGVMEFGMLGRGEHSEITTFVGKTVDSEMSGNMIDLCPVGALTSKPFRYSARTWELSRRKSVSPHDSVGANLVVQVKNNRVMRVLPFENEAINECWISDKDRFSYEGLNSEERLTKPMLKQGGQWIETDWQTALEYVAKGLKGIAADHGANALAMLASAHSTAEELFLVKQLANELKTPNVDFRLRQQDFSAPVQGAPWLGMPIADLSNVDAAFVVGSFLRRDHPLFASRLRQAAKNGAKLHFLHATGDDSLIPTAQRIVAAPSAWLDELAGIAAAVAQLRGVTLPDALAGVTASPAAQAVAQSLANGERRAVLLGNVAVRHPQFAKLHAVAQWIADNTGATFGFLTEAANTVGAHVVGALPGEGGLNAREAFAQPRKGYVLLNVEPEFDTADPAQALAALNQAEMVVVMSPFKHGLDYADVLLPVAPFTETAGTFVNAEGTVQSFNGVVRPLGDTRPAWKVLRVLGSLLGLPNFEYETAEEVRVAALGDAGVAGRLSNQTSVAPARAAANAANGGFERLADVPIYHADALVRRAGALHLTAAAKAANVAALPAALFDKLGLKEGDAVRVRQGERAVQLPAVRDANLAETVVRVSAATPAGAALGSLSGELVVEKA